MIESDDELQIHKFCLFVSESYKNTFNNWDGYEIKKISKQTLFNFADKKRKLSFDYFKKLLLENSIVESSTLIAGILYLDLDETKELLFNIVKDLKKDFQVMTEEELKECYKFVLMIASTKNRKFSLKRISNQ